LILLEVTEEGKEEEQDLNKSKTKGKIWVKEKGKE